MIRTISSTLLDWAKSSNRKPLLLRGARQVGKTTLVEQLSEQFENFVSINLEIETDYQSCFESLSPQDICNGISFLSDQVIEPGKTLLFLDEIQACPPAIMALRYFRERMPDLHVIGAGSLLEFALQSEQISMPVGRIEYLYLHPCTFEEWLGVESQKSQILSSFSLENPPPEAIHKALLRDFKNYMITGGMPEAVESYVSNGDLYLIQRIQNAILQTYRDDFGKYATHAQLKHLQTIYSKAPGLTGQQITYSKIAPDERSRDLKQAIQLLEYAGLIKRIISTSATGLPLITTANEKKFKMLFLDVGLVQRASGLSAELLLEQDMQKLNDGSLAEQVVGQLLMAHQDPFTRPDLFFWARDKKNSNAEVDYVMNFGGRIIPIEVKSGTVGKLKSLQLIMKEKQLPLGVKISAAPLSLEQSILNVPFYLIGQLEGLIKQTI